MQQGALFVSALSSASRGSDAKAHGQPVAEGVPPATYGELREAGGLARAGVCGSGAAGRVGDVH
jgi:hypothetical protein